MNYDQALSKIPFYVIHPEYMPYIGEKYEEYKILIVGESHYIGQSPETQKFTVDYFTTNWWNGNCGELDAVFSGWYDTRLVVKKYLTGVRRHGHSIFTNCIKSFSDVVLDHPITYISTEESQKFVYFSFMNFFQMPSLFEGMNFWKSLTINNTEEKALAVWYKTVEESGKVLDSVIDIIKPELVIFVSKSAYGAYKGSNAKHKDDENVKGICHPGCSYWFKKRKSDGLCGKDDFEKCLKQFIGKE